MGEAPAKGKERSVDTSGSAGFLAICAVLIVGCANPGPPRPPSLQLPELVTNLSAERIGNRVLLRWTTPSRTTEDLDVRGRLFAEICRTDPSPSTLANPPARKGVSACAPVKRATTLPGADSIWDDLPPALLTDPIGLLTYRIRILNVAGRSAGLSAAAAYAASGTAPAPVDSLTAVPGESGGVLQWKSPGDGGALLIELTRTNLAPESPGFLVTKGKATTSPASFLPFQKGKDKQTETHMESAEVHLRASARSKANHTEGMAGTVDTTATMGVTYSYRVEVTRLAPVGGLSLEIHSQPSAPVTLVMRDTFPPKVPSGLATIPGATEPVNGAAATPYIDLSWEPNSEPDLAGYLVYRQLARPNGDPQGPLGKLTPLPIPSPAYRDVAVKSGQRYIYSVTAVDASGNESAPSAKAQEMASSPEAGSPP